MERNADLEKKLAADPSNIDAYLVYADFLQSKGDPRGELITLQHAGKTAEATAHLEKHKDAILGPLAKYTKTLDDSEDEAFEWHNGFIRKARLSYDSNAGNDKDVSLEKGLTELLKHPCGMLLEEIVVPMNMLDDGAYFEGVAQAIGEFGAPNLRRLRIGEFTHNGPGGVDDGYEYEISWCGIGDASGMWKGLPKLESLTLQMGLGSSSVGPKDVLGTINLPKLRHLEVISSGISKENVKSFAEANWPELETMDLWFGDENYGGDAGYEDITPILEGTKLPKLKRLGLMNCQFVDVICEFLGGAKILPQLKEVSLAYGVMGDSGAQALAADKNAYSHLEKLELHANGLTSAGVAAVETLCKNVTTDEQKGENERYVSVSE